MKIVDFRKSELRLRNESFPIHLLNGSDVISSQIEKHGIWERRIIESIIHLINLNENISKIFVDIGSHIGSYLLPICSLFNPNIRCIGLEIDGLLFNISQDNMEINHISHKVQLINKAIIENSHINYSFCSPSINNSGNGQIYNNFNENNERYCGMLKTNQLINSSSLLMEMKRKDNEFVFLKIDVEGSEWRFFCNETFLPNQCKLNEQWFPKTQNKFVVVVVMEIGVMQFENNKLLRSLLKGLNNYFGGSAWETNRINRVDVSIDNLPWNLLFIDYRLLLQLSDDVLLNF
ncbi:hypothetical protein SNEBB_006620 [Seison nebaliae]|nr:hypothetical protein SNEBB_006620 [Seison nebaliae]